MTIVLPTPSDLTNLQNLLQNNVVNNLGGLTTGESIGIFLNDLTDINWTDMNVGIQNFLVNYSGQYNGLRVQISLSDGSLAYDSASNNNSYLSNSIGNNVNGLVSVSGALQNGSGYEYQNKYSTQFGKYVVAYNALREGLTTSYSLGCSIVSYQVINY